MSFVVSDSSLIKADRSTEFLEFSYSVIVKHTIRTILENKMAFNIVLCKSIYKETSELLNGESYKEGEILFMDLFNKFNNILNLLRKNLNNLSFSCV